MTWFNRFWVCSENTLTTGVVTNLEREPLPELSSAGFFSYSPQSDIFDLASVMMRIVLSSRVSSFNPEIRIAILQ